MYGSKRMNYLHHNLSEMYLKLQKKIKNIKKMQDCILKNSKKSNVRHSKTCCAKAHSRDKADKVLYFQ